MAEIAESNNRIEYISLASVVSAIAVIYLHANSSFWKFSYSRCWITSNIIECVFYFAVPVFFMISGALLIDFNKKYDLKKYFSKRITKTVIPYVVWSFIGLAIQVYYVHNVDPTKIDLFYIIKGLINGSLVVVYWFFIPLFSIYLTIPVFSFIPDDKKKDIFIYVSSLIFIINVLYPFIVSVFNLSIPPVIHADTVALFGGGLFFVLMGYLLHNYELSKKYKILIYLLAISGLLMHILGTYYLSIPAGRIIETYKGYTNLPCVLYSVGIYVFIKYDLVRLLKFNIISKIIGYLDFYTFGIYLIHWYLIKVLIITLGWNIFSIYFRLFSPIPILIMSVVIIYLLRKIPLVEKIVPS